MLAPDLQQHIGLISLAQALADRRNILFIEGNPGRRCLLDLLPLGLLKTHPRPVGNLPELLAVIVEAIEDVIAKGVYEK